MAYVPFASAQGGTAAPSKGGGYQSYFGFKGEATGSQKAYQATLPKVPTPVAPPKPSGDLLSKVGNFVNNDVVKPTVNTSEKALNTVTAGGAGLIGLGTAGVQAVGGNKQGAKNTLTATQQTINQFLDKGVGGKGAYLTSKQAASTGGGTKGLVQNFVKPTTQAVTDIAPLVMPVGKVAKGASLLTKVARGVRENAALGGATTAANESLNGKLNGKDILKGAASAGVIGGLIPLAHEGIKAGVQSTTDKLPVGNGQAAKDLLQNSKQNTLLNKARTSNTADAVGKTATNTPVASLTHNVRVNDLIKKNQTIATQANQAKQTAIPTEPAKNISQQAVPTIQQHMAENYKPASVHPDETFAANYLQNNTEKALKDYQARTEKIFGSKNIVAGDDAKYSVPGMAPDKSMNYHEPASEFVKGYYKHLLADPESTHKPVMITAGGTGAGKTSALKKYFVDNGGNVNDYAAIVDTNLTTLHSATSRIEPALATGHDVQVKFVYRDPVEAFQNGVIPRAASEGRAVTASTHAETHAGSLDAIKQIADKYKSNPNVHVEVIDNSRGAGKAQAVPLDFLHDKSYTKGEIQSKIHSLLDSQLQEGKLTNEQHTIFKGSDTPVKPTASEATHSLGEAGSNNGTMEPKGNTETGRQSEPQRQTVSQAVNKELAAREATPEQPTKISGSALKSEQRAVQAGLVKDLGEKTKYDTGSYKTEATNAVKLAYDNPTEAKAIAMGEKPGNNTIHEVAVRRAVENKALQEKDTQTLLDLSKSTQHSVTSEAAQRLGAEGHNADDAVNNLRTLAKTRTAAFEAKNKVKASEAIKATVKDYKANKTKLSLTPKTWSDFIESIRC